MYYVQSLLRESLLDYDEDAAVAESEPSCAAEGVVGGDAPTSAGPGPAGV